MYFFCFLAYRYKSKGFSEFLAQYRQKNAIFSVAPKKNYKFLKIFK